MTEKPDTSNSDPVAEVAAEPGYDVIRAATGEVVSAEALRFFYMADDLARNLNEIEGEGTYKVRPHGQFYNAQAEPVFGYLVGGEPVEVSPLPDAMGPGREMAFDSPRRSPSDPPRGVWTVHYYDQALGGVQERHVSADAYQFNDRHHWWTTGDLIVLTLKSGRVNQVELEEPRELRPG